MGFIYPRILLDIYDYITMINAENRPMRVVSSIKYTEKNIKNTPNNLELKKYYPKCRKH